MTNTQLWIATVIPTFTVLAGILLNFTAIGRVENRLSSIEADLRRFYQILGEHSAKLDRR